MTRDPTAVRMQPSAWAVDAKENGRQSGRFAEAGGSTAPSNFPVPCSRLARPSRYAPGRPPSPRWYRRLTSASRPALHKVRERYRVAVGSVCT